MTKMTLTDSLKRFRRELNVTQKQASSIVGVSERSYGEYERGTAKIPASAILKLADTFGVSADYLLGRTDKPSGSVAQIVIDSSVIEEIRRAAVAEVDKQIALKFPHARTNFATAG